MRRRGSFFLCPVIFPAVATAVAVVVARAKKAEEAAVIIIANRT